MTEDQAPELAPALSVVVPSVNGWADLRGCLDALAGERTRVPLEVLVVDRIGADLRAATIRQYPWVRVLEAPSGTSIPDLRRMAFEVANAPVVAVIEDHVQVPAGWTTQMLEAQARNEQVVGGSVENAATDRLVDWAAFLCEYSHLLPPLPAGPVPAVTGNNVSYRRELLERFRDATGSGRWEHDLHNVLRQHGISLDLPPGDRVGHKKHYTIGECTRRSDTSTRVRTPARVWLPARPPSACYTPRRPPFCFRRCCSRASSRARGRVRHSGRCYCAPCRFCRCSSSPGLPAKWSAPLSVPAILWVACVELGGGPAPRTSAHPKEHVVVIGAGRPASRPRIF